jgi:hypothetical protein
MFRKLRAAIIVSALAATSATARGPTPGIAGGGSRPLTEIIDLARPYPNLVLQMRLQLVRANLKREQVSCAGGRYSAQWSTLGGGRLAPYTCPIGKRTLRIEAAQTYFDRNGRKIKVTDPEVMARAATVKESALTWQWQ